MEHILPRHAFDTVTTKLASKFAQGMGHIEIRGLINEAHEAPEVITSFHCSTPGLIAGVRHQEWLATIPHHFRPQRHLGIEKSGVTREIAKAWAKFYRNEALRNPTNPSAAGRADLMEAAAKLLR